jgi:hypothetical protein
VPACHVTVTRQPVDKSCPEKLCQKHMTLEVFGSVVLHVCEEDIDPDGKLSP